MFRNQEQRVSKRQLLPLWQRMVLFSAAYLLSAWLGSVLSPANSVNVSFWLPAGLFAAVLLLNPTRDWIWLALAVFPANFLFDYVHDRQFHPLMIVIFYISGVIRSVLGAWLVRRFVAESPTLCTLKEFWGVMALTGILSAAVGALLGASALVAFGQTQSFLNSWWIWWTGSGMAVLVFSPLLLTWLRRSEEARRVPMPLIKKLEAAALFIGLSLSVWYFFVDSQGVNAHKVPLLIFVLWAGLRFGVRGAALIVFWLAVLMAFLTTHYLRGVSGAEIVSGAYVVTLQVYLAVAAFTGLIPAIILGERDRAMLNLREGEESLRATLENTPNVAVQWFDRRGRVTYWNQASETLYGWTAAEALGKTLDELIFTREQSEDFLQALAGIEKSGRPIGPVEFAFRHRAGTDGVILSTLFQIHTPGGDPRFVCMDVDLTQRNRAEALSRTQVEILEMIASDRPMSQTLDRLLRAIEARSPDMLCSVLLLDRDGTHFRHGAAPSLPEAYLQAVDGATMGASVGSCGAAMSRGEAVFTADIATDPLWTEYKQLALPHGLRACWSTPIFDSQRRVLGTFAIFRRQTGLPEEHHRQLIEMATHMAAVCIGRRIGELEREEAVTREKLARINYTLQVIAAQEDERTRIAGELHDSLGQNLLLIKNHAQLSLRKGADPAECEEHIGTISRLATACIAEARRISHDLHPPLLEHLGLTRALGSMIEKTDQASAVTFSHKLEPVDEIFSGGAAMNLYRIVQESLNNILKHSGAKQVEIKLERDIHEVQLTIKDDGRGFAPEKLADDKPGLGLKNMADRTRMLGGKLKIDSQPGQGTRIEVTVPIGEQAK